MKQSKWDLEFVGWDQHFDLPDLSEKQVDQLLRNIFK